MDYSRFEIGMSERRTSWLIAFIDKLETDNWLVLVRRFQEFHGRLWFASQVLPGIKPLLAPGYATLGWLQSEKTSTMKMPEMVALVCIFIRAKFKEGLMKISCIVPEVYKGEIFRTDAKCDPGRVVLAG